MPGLNASRIEPAPVRAHARVDVDRDELDPGGTRNGVSGVSFSAIFMKSRKIGAV